MRLFRKRPFAFFAASGILCLFLFLSLLRQGRLSTLALILCAAGAAILFALLLVGDRVLRRSPSGFFHAHPSILPSAALFAAALLLSSLCMLFHCEIGSLRIPFTYQGAVSGTADGAGTPIAVEGEILKNRSTSYNSFLEVNITRFDGASCDFGATITLPQVSEGGAGDRFAAKAVFSLPEETANGFPLRRYYFSEGIFLQGEVPEEGDFELTGHSAGLSALLSDFRERIGGTLDRRLSGNPAALLRALLLGDRDPLPDPVRRDFKTLGISHLLAVSGLHLAVLCGMLSFLLRKLRLPKALHFPFLASFCLFFMALCGFPGSVCRAGMMYLFALAAPLFRTRGDGVTGLFGGALLILLHSPWRLFDSGLQMSFLAVLGILTFGRLLLKRRERAAGKPGILRRIGGASLASLKISFAAILFTFPVSAELSGSISLLSPIATLLFAPLIEGLLLLAPAALLLSFLPGISDLLFFLTDQLASFLLFLSSKAVYFEKTVLALNTGTLSLLCLGLFLILAVLLIFRFSDGCLRRLPILLFLCILLGNTVGLWIGGWNAGALYCRDGTNEAILLKSGGETLLIDLSAGTGGIQNTALNRMRELSSAGIDTLLLTHLHARHRTALFSLAQNGYLKKLYLPTPENESESGHYTAITEEAAHLGIEVIPYRRDGSAFSPAKDVSFTPAVYTKLSRSTHPAVAFRLDKGEISLLYVGSAFPAKTLAGLRASDADCVLFGRHGPIRKDDDDDGYAAMFGETSPAVILADETFSEAEETFPERVLLPDDRDFLRLRFGE